jgi:mycothiol system anti-sigma-R factor
MKCKDCSEKLDRFVDRELNSTEILEMQLHLEACPDCTDNYEFQAHLKRLVKHSCECDTAPPAFREKLRQLLS